MRQINHLYQTIRKSDTLDTLLGNVEDVIRFANERSWLIAAVARRARELAGPEGLREVALALKLSEANMLRYSEVWRLFSQTRREYPRLQFSHFYTLVKTGARRDTHRQWLDKADNNSWMASQLSVKIRPPKKSDYCICSKCGKRHKKGDTC